VKGVAIAAAALLFAGCGDFLDIEPRNLVILEQFWDTKSDVDNCVAGCYEGMQSTNFLVRIAAWGEFRSENVKEGNNAEKDDLHMYKLLQENIDASNVYTDWAAIYTVINRCNTVIKYAPNVSAKDPSFTESELKATIAEVSAIRDLCYFFLIRTFQNVPFTMEAYTDDDQEMALPATGFYTVLDALIADLESVQNDAVRRYPTDGDQRLYQTGRITQDAIHAILCEMYLWKKDWQKCIDYAELVIESKRKAAKEDEGTLYNEMTKYFNGYPLIHDWTEESDHFGNAYNQIFGTGNSVESIFELTFMRNDNMLQNGFVNYYYGKLEDGGWYYRVKPSDYVGLDASNNAFKLYKNNYDSRCHESYNPLTQSATASQIGKYVFTSQDWEVKTTDNSVTNYLCSFSTKDKSHTNWIFYRLTDVMLMKAEALVELSAGDNTAELTEAFKLVDAVNRRSIMKDPDKLTTTDVLDASAYTAKTAMRDLVRAERHRELLFEGKRWYDLVRYTLWDGNTSYLVQQVSNKGLKNQSIINTKLNRIESVFWPYNDSELKVNPNLKQNPAFGSGENQSYEQS
jgi:hypothetical protein